MDKKDSVGFNSPGIDSQTGFHDKSCLKSVGKKYLRREKPWSLLMLDIDHFKLINDIYGHLTGDKVLKQAALTIQVNLKDSDIAIRFGGDEFIAVLPDTVEEGALDLAQRLIYEIRRISFISGPHISISIGVSQSRVTDETIMDLVSRSDKALYKAKEAGRGRFYFFTEDAGGGKVPEIVFSHLVGRRLELQKLRQLLEETVTDSSRFAVISGEAGVGKTRLADELLNYCDFMKSIVVRNSVMEHSQSEPFSLLIEPVRDTISGLSSSEFDTVRKAVEPVHPATLDLFPELKATAIDDTVYFREERLRFRIFRDISAVVAAISSIYPVTIIMDNLQWITEPDLAILSFVARNTSAANILFLCILRRDEISEKIFSRLLSIRSSLPLLNLEVNKMTAEETRNLILFSMKDPNVPQQVQEFLSVQSGGNPLFLRELLKSCVDMGYISCSKSGKKKYNIPCDVKVPVSIEQIITMRLSSISTEAAELLEIVSLSPDRFTLSLLESMTGHDRVELARKVDECIKSGIIEEIIDEGKDPGFRFTHAAVRDYLSSNLPESLKLVYHRRMAAHFEESFVKGGKELLRTVVYHYSHSKDNSHAARYALLAAEQAFNRGANADAIHCYTEYINRMPAVSESTELFSVYTNLGSLFSITGEVQKADSYLKMALDIASDSKELADVNLRLGKNNLNRSLYPESLENFNEAVKICNEADLKNTVIFRTFVETLIETSFVHRLQGNYDEAFLWLNRTEKHMEDYGSEIPEDILALYYTRKADVISELDSEDEALELYSKALEIYTRIYDLPGQATVLNNMHGIYSSQGDYSKSLNTMEEVIRIDMKMDDKLGLAIGYYNIAEYYQEINMLDLAREYYDKYLNLNDTINNKLGIGYGRYGLGMLNWLEGELEKSRFFFDGAVDVFEKLKVSRLKTECNLMVARICIQTGEFDKAGKIIESVTREKQNSSIMPDILYVKGLLLLFQNDSSRESLELAIVQFRTAIDSSVKLSEVNIALFYSAIALAMRKMGKEEDIIALLREGSRKLAEKLQKITPYSVRKSIMTRRDLAEFINLCHSRGLPFPPDEIVFAAER